MENENIEKEITQNQPTEAPENFPIKKQKPWLIIILVVLLIISLGTVGVFAYTNYLLKNKIITESINLKEMTISPSPMPSLTTTPISENWETFSTEGIFGLTQEILEEYPSVFNGNLSFSYPKSWNLRIWEKGPEFSNEKKYGVFLGFSLGKSHPNYSSPGELPPENSASIVFRFKITNLDPNQLVENFSSEFGHGSVLDKPVKNITFNGFNAAKIMRNQEFPSSVVFSVSSTTVFDIDIEFLDNNEDKDYSRETINEIEGILNSVKVQENL